VCPTDVIELDDITSVYQLGTSKPKKTKPEKRKDYESLLTLSLSSLLFLIKVGNYMKLTNKLAH
jgi:hypothetical protein